MIGGVLLRKVIRYMDKPLFIISILLFVIGLIMVFSSSNVTAYMKYAVSPYNYFIKQAIFLLVGLVFAVVMVNFNSKAYGMFSWLLLIVIGVSLLLLLLIGKSKNQAISWFEFGPFSFQPSEFAKIISIVWMSSYYEKKKNKLNSYFVSLFPLLVCIAIALLIFMQPDLGTTIIYLVIVSLLFLAEPIPEEIKRRVVFICIGVVILGLLVLSFSGKKLIFERQLQRLNISNPCDRLLETGNQVCNGYIAMNNGGLMGKGLGNSTQKYLYLPEPYTDFIFTITIEELGAIVGCIILVLYMIVLYRILKIGKNCYNNRNSAMCYGVAIYLFCHIAVNILGIFGLMPMTGVPLPFMSYGGSFTICLVAALTLVQRASVETGIQTNMKKEASLRKKVA